MNRDLPSKNQRQKVSQRIRVRFRIHDFLEEGVIQKLHAFHAGAEVKKFLLILRKPFVKLFTKPGIVPDLCQNLGPLADEGKVCLQICFHDLRILSYGKQQRFCFCRIASAECILPFLSFLYKYDETVAAGYGADSGKAEPKPV